MQRKTVMKAVPLPNVLVPIWILCVCLFGSIQAQGLSMFHTRKAGSAESGATDARGGVGVVPNSIPASQAEADSVDVGLSDFEDIATFDLFVDPVIAQDGHIYERKTWEKIEADSVGPKVQSALGGYKMGKGYAPVGLPVHDEADAQKTLSDFGFPFDERSDVGTKAKWTLRRFAEWGQKLIDLRIQQRKSVENLQTRKDAATVYNDLGMLWMLQKHGIVVLNGVTRVSPEVIATFKACDTDPYAISGRCFMRQGRADIKGLFEKRFVTERRPYEAGCVVPAELDQGQPCCGRLGWGYTEARGLNNERACLDTKGKYFRHLVGGGLVAAGAVTGGAAVGGAGTLMALGSHGATAAGVGLTGAGVGLTAGVFGLFGGVVGAQRTQGWLEHNSIDMENRRHAYGDHLPYEM